MRLYHVLKKIYRKVIPLLVNIIDGFDFFFLNFFGMIAQEVCSIFKFLLDQCTVSRNNKPLVKKISFKDTIPQTDIVIYYDVATYPTLYFGIHMVTHQKQSFLYTSRHYTINDLPNHVYPIEISIEVPNTNLDQWNHADQKIINHILEINKNNPQSTFTLYINADRATRIINFFYCHGILEDRFQVVLLVDGLMTYELWNLVSRRQDLFFQDLSKNMGYYLSSKQYVDPEVFADNGYIYFLILLNKNISIWWPIDLLTRPKVNHLNNLFVKSERMFELSLKEYVNFLSQDQQKQFLSIIGMNKEFIFKGKHRSLSTMISESSKKKILILGTNAHAYPFKKDKNIDYYVNKIKEHYGDTFEYWYKPHPSDSYIPDGVVEFPQHIVLEPFLLFYADVFHAIGGIRSTVFLILPTHIEKFLFDQHINKLSYPLNVMYERDLLLNLKVFN
ncbi:MAG: hypothetical protein ACRCVW_04795 [Brevinema sp.]